LNKINKKRYIGQTYSIKNRFYRHKNELLKNKHNNTHLQNAWNKYGQPFTESFKNALTNIWELVKSIGKSFEDVWLNGTGEYTCSLILQILTNIFNIIGSLASKFSEAWN